MITPTIHSNGTSKGELFNSYVTALLAVEAAIDRVAKTSPHARDYYVQGDTAHGTAVAEHQARLRLLNTVSLELAALAEHCS